MVETQKHIAFPLVYKLIELALILPVSTATVERAFSTMKIIKTELRNKISDDWLNDLMVCYTERDIFKTLNDDTITLRFQSFKSRRMNLRRTLVPLWYDRFIFNVHINFIVYDCCTNQYVFTYILAFGVIVCVC